MDSADIPRIAGTLAGVERALEAFERLHRDVNMTRLGNPNQTYDLLNALFAARELYSQVNHWSAMLAVTRPAPDEAESLRYATEAVTAQYEAYPPTEV